MIFSYPLSRCVVSFRFVLFLLHYCLTQFYPPSAVPAALRHVLVAWLDAAFLTSLRYLQCCSIDCCIWCQYIRLLNGFDVMCRMNETRYGRPRRKKTRLNYDSKNDRKLLDTIHTKTALIRFSTFTRFETGTNSQVLIKTRCRHCIPHCLASKS